jgi:hypothetical protein
VVGDAHADRIALAVDHPGALVVLQAHDEARIALQAQAIDRVGAEVDHVLDPAAQRRPVARLAQPDPLRPDREADRAAGRALGGRAGDAGLARGQAHPRGGAVALQHLAFQEVGLTDEVGDEVGGRVLVDFGRAADLENLSGVHHGHAVRHGQRLALVVGDEDEGDAGLVLNALELDLHVLAQFEIERRERLIEEQHLGPVGECASECDALLLAA